MKFYPYKKGGAKIVLAMVRGGGGTNSFGVVCTQYLEVLAILKVFFPFCSPPFQVINDQFLRSANIRNMFTRFRLDANCTLDSPCRSSRKTPYVKFVMLYNL